MTKPASWGVVATIKAPAHEILNFAAYHLEMGAKRIFIFLDAPNPDAEKALRDHPKCRVTVTDDAYWAARGKRPDRHPARQTINASRCYNRRPNVDWLAHIDVDEFLWSERPIGEQLAALPPEHRSARVHPIEALADDPTDPPPAGQVWCKGHARAQRRRREETNAIYPTFGAHLNGGFISHVVGKVFVRTGLPKTKIRIHNAFFEGQQDQDVPALPGTQLVHFHAPDWDTWQQHFDYRMVAGSYHDTAKPAPMQEGRALTIRELFAHLEAEGEPALRAFFDEVCTATPRLRQALSEFGHLHAITLDLEKKRGKVFPGAA